MNQNAFSTVWNSSCRHSYAADSSFVLFAGTLAFVVHEVNGTSHAAETCLRTTSTHQRKRVMVVRVAKKTRLKLVSSRDPLMRLYPNLQRAFERIFISPTTFHDEDSRRQSLHSCSQACYRATGCPPQLARLNVGPGRDVR